MKKGNGIYQQIMGMQDLNGNKPSLKRPSREEIESAISSIFGNNIQDVVTYDKLREKVLDGYAYRIKNPRATLMTGKGGVLNYLDISEEQGIDPWMAGNLITVEDKTLNELKIIENER